MKVHLKQTRKTHPHTHTHSPHTHTPPPTPTQTDAHLQVSLQAIWAEDNSLTGFCKSISWRSWYQMPYLNCSPCMHTDHITFVDVLLPHDILQRVGEEDETDKDEAIRKEFAYRHILMGLYLCIAQWWQNWRNNGFTTWVKVLQYVHSRFCHFSKMWLKNTLSNVERLKHLLNFNFVLAQTFSKC